MKQYRREFGENNKKNLQLANAYAGNAAETKSSDFTTETPALRGHALQSACICVGMHAQLHAGMQNVDL